MKHNCKQNVPTQTELLRIEGCVSGVAAYRDDIRDLETGVVVKGEVVTESPITGEFVPFPCKSKECNCCITNLETTNCCCSDDYTVIGTEISSGWVNQFSNCSCTLDGDLVSKWTECRDDLSSSRSYKMFGLSSGCNTSSSFQTINYAFYSIIRTDVSVPYWIIYIYELGANRSWVVYNRQEIPKCIDFEIRRIGGVVKYYINGSLAFTSTVSSTGPLTWDDSWHGSLNNHDGITIKDRKICNV